MMVEANKQKADKRPLRDRKGRWAKGKQAGPGRPKGSHNKTSVALAAMVTGALDELGGQEWLVRAARKDPKAFMQLVGKLLPREINVSGAFEMPFYRALARPGKAGQKEVAKRS